MLKLSGFYCICSHITDIQKQYNEYTKQWYKSIINFSIERIDTKLELKNVIESSIKVDIHSWYEVMNAKPLQRIDDGDISTLTVRVSTLTNLCAEVAEDLITVHTLYQEVCYKYIPLILSEWLGKGC